MALVKRIVLGLGGLLAVFALAVFAWASWPISVDRSAPDPALTYLNSKDESDVELREAYFEHEGAALHYIEGGEGETVVFLHGFPSFWFSFLRQVDDLKGDYRVVAVDGLGAGKSDAPSDVESYKLEAMAAHLEALIDHFGAEKVHLVGHDWGSAFAIGFAQRHPDRVLSVTGLSAPPMNASLHALEQDESARATASYVERFKSANPALLVALSTDETIYNGAYRPLVDAGKLNEEEGALFRQGTSDPKRTNAHINWYRANAPHPDEITERDFWPSRTARVSMPALYIWGEDDQIFNQSAIDRLIELSDDPSLLMFPGVGHWPHVRMAPEVNLAIREHMAQASEANAAPDGP